MGIYKSITDYIMIMTLKKEKIDGGRRKEEVMFSRMVIREMLGMVYGVH